MRKIVRVTSIHFVTYQQNNNPPSYLRRRSHGYCKVDGATYFATQVGGGGAFTTKETRRQVYIYADSAHTSYDYFEDLSLTFACSFDLISRCVLIYSSFGLNGSYTKGEIIIVAAVMSIRNGVIILISLYGF